MLTIYNKIDKNMENTSGFQVVSDIEMLERPFLLCISAYDNFSKAIYGIMREGAQALRLQTTQGPAARFVLNEFPVDVLGIRFEEDEFFQQPYMELTDKFLFPFLKQKGSDVDSMMKQARKMNFFTYCEGANTYKGAEDRLIVLLKKEQYSDADISQILSQISLVALQSKLATGELKATSVSFVDINDPEVECQKTDSYRNLLATNQHNHFYSSLGNSNGVLYIYQGSGIHSVKRFFKEKNNRAKPIVCAVVSMLLENSLYGMSSSEFIPLNSNQVLLRIEQYSDDSITPDELLKELDDTLSYNGATRYTESSVEVKIELDSVYKLLRKTNEMFIRSLREQEIQNERYKALIRGISEFCSDITCEQILTYAHVWYSNPDKQILSAISDKQIRAAVEERMK